ncbi:helix-turn-helix domain-containing protein [Sphingobacterium lumbrici]|uniref:helix-turn-helix domain-containing protein n=1 Tax=Sphingobacterium lumbrici TaxID=2559600 RepID=UPI00112CBE16
MDKKPHATHVDAYLIQKVKELRTKKGLSQAKLALALDVSVGYIGHVESPKDRAKYSLSMLPKLASVLECEYADLLPPITK